MTQLPSPGIPIPIAAPELAGASPDRWMAELGALLRELDSVAPGVQSLPATPEESTDDQLAKKRLGIAGSLFAALQCKHAATASHSIRVALTCSAWATRLDFNERQREQLEIVALLHDIGVVGTPDQVLLKPTRLDNDESAIMTRARAMSLEILRRGCTSTEILGVVENVAAWYDGSHGTQSPSGEQIPLAARMIAVAEAFDAMTTDHVYRPALSQERAMAELFRCAGSQFDPILVRQFVEMLEGDRGQLRKHVAARWLLSLDPQTANAYWDFTATPAPTASTQGEASLFEAKLLDNMYDAVVFVNSQGRIAQWNHGAERLTGIAGASIRQQRWHPDILKLSDEKNRIISETDCPVLAAISSGVQSLRRLTVWGRNGRCVAVDSHVIPVIGGDGNTQGAVLLLHDASSEISLEQRCQSLADKASRDPLTQVANRAEFDRVHAMFVTAHQQQQVPCALLMCDLDRFKRVNDTFGHQAGDEVIKSLAALLKGACHAGDLVARYGGEEFVMLLADCDNTTASRRADQIRLALSQVQQPGMNGQTITVSFGVTEIQPGDTAETMLRRADRALLTAKENGRNQVVQLGSGLDFKLEPRADDDAFSAMNDQGVLLQQTLVTPVPTKMAIEKLRGFVADHEAIILKIDGNQIHLEIAETCDDRLRRLTDRPVTFQLDLRFEEQRLRREKDKGEINTGGVLRTQVFVAITPRKTRDRRHADVAERAQQVLTSLRSYLMAAPEDQDSPLPEGTMVKMKHVLLPWLRGKK
ncbi:MAG: diguanylate cyclase domain-containing protein [Thermoguttaceae bacterium]